MKTHTFIKISILIISFLTFFSVEVLSQNTVLKFDGVDDYVELDSKVGNGVRTIEFWFKPDININSNLNELVGLVVRNTTSGNPDEFNISFQPSRLENSGSLKFNITEKIGDENRVYSDQKSWEAGVWHHVAAVVHPELGMMLFIDGIKQASTKDYIKSTDTNNYKLTIGCWGNRKELDRYFNGCIDDLRISDKALYTSNFIPPCPNIRADSTTAGLWNFNEVSGSVVIDVSNNGHNGIINGATRQLEEICELNYLEDCLVAYYPFNGNSNDESGNENNGVVYGANLTEDRFGEPLSAYEFDGIDDYIRIRDTFYLNPQNLSICVWYKTVSYEGHGNDAIINKAYYRHEYPYYQYQIGISGDHYKDYSHSRFSISIGIDDNWIIYSTENDFWQIGQWYFLSMTYDGQYFKSFINGVLMDSVEVVGKLSSYNTDLYIGKHLNRPNATPGVIDDIRIYDCAITESKIKELYEFDLSSTDTSSVDPPPIDSLQSKRIEVYPNPTNGVIHINTAGLLNCRAEVYDILGKEMRTFKNNITTIRIDDLASAVYLLKISDENGLPLKFEKIIKK